MNKDFKLPNGWRIEKIRNVCKVINGTTPKTQNLDYWNGSIVWITPTDLGKLNGNYIISSDRKISKKGLMQTNLTLVPSGSVVMSSRAPIGHLAIASVPLCTNQGCKSFVPDENELDSEFLFYALKINVPALREMGSGATFKEISKTKLENYEIPVPPLYEQQRIVKVLNRKLATVEEARAANEAQVENANALPGAFLREVFEGEEAKKWKVVSLESISTLISKGTTPTTHGYSYTDHGFPFLRAEDVSGSQVNFESVAYYISPETHEFLKRSKLKPGDLLITIAGTLGRVGYVGKNAPEMNCNQAVAFIRLDLNKVNCRFACLACQSELVFNNLISKKAGGALQNLNLQQIKSINIPLPPLNKQRRIVEILENKLLAFDNVKKAIRTQQFALNSLSTAYIRQAFNGEL